MLGHAQGSPPAFDTPPGARYLGDGRSSFLVWAPQASSMEVVLLTSAPQYLPMERDSWGYWRTTLDNVGPGTHYRYRIDGKVERPDPAARHQPNGVHGPSAVVAADFAWSDAGWFGTPLRDYVIYELHVGTFSPDGSFDGIIAQLPALRELGITAIELMPIAHFPGNHNWGYDGVYLYAPHAAYGGDQGLKRLVDACHANGLAVVLDVVYNHFGPEGNYLWDYAPAFFTSRHKTPWGDAINYDGRDSDPVRHFVIANALYWLREYHIDALRLDAVQTIFDGSAYHLLEELVDAVRLQAERINRRAYLIAESDANDPRLIRPTPLGGYGLDGQWADDFHHALHVLLTGERSGYYAGFGEIGQLARAYRQAYVFAGDYATHRGRRFGRRPEGCTPEQFIVCTQNHDQIGNRALGDRLAANLGLAQLKLAAAALLLAPFTPLLFMGEEYAEPAPFQYFTDHSDPELVQGVRDGRKREFAAFVGSDHAVPDPQSPATFERSRLNHALRSDGKHAVIWSFYRELLRLRQTLPALRSHELHSLEAVPDETARTLILRRIADSDEIWAGLNFAATPAELPLPPGRWFVLLDSAAPVWSEPDATAQPTNDADRIEETRIEETRIDGIVLAAYSVVLLQKIEGNQ